MLSIAFASLVTSDTTENSTVVCQGSACQPEKAGPVTGTSETSKNKRRHSTAADSNSPKDHAKMAPNSESSIAGDSKSLKQSSETSVGQVGGTREKRWAYKGARGTRSSYFHPDLGRCLRKRNYYADDTSAESSIYHARPWRTKPEIRRRRRWRSNSGGITGNRHWFQNEPKGFVEPQSFRRLYRTPQYLERRNLGAPLRQAEGHGTVSESQGRSIEHWGDDGSGPIRQWREPGSRLYRDPRDSRHERGFWSKLFHFHSSSHNETKSNETTVSPYIQASTSKQLVLNIPEVGKPETVQQSPQDQESTKIDTISNTDPLLSTLEKELAVNVTTSKDLSPSPMELKVNFDPKIIESSELNNDHSEVSDDSGQELSGTETAATKDLWNEERDMASGDTYKMAIAGADMENTESNNSLTITDFVEKMPEPQNLVPPQISLNETSESNCVDCPTSNNDGTDYLQQKLPEEQASKDLLTKQNPVSESYQMLMENTSIGDALPANNLAGKILVFQNAAPLQLPMNETFQVKRAKSTAPNRDHSKVSGYSSRIVAGTMSGMTKDFLSKQKHLPVDTTYKMFMTGPGKHNSIIKGSWDTKDAAGVVGSTSDHRPINGAEKESEVTVNKRRYEEWPTSYLNAGRPTSDIIRKTESKRRRDVMDQNLRTTFTNHEQGVGQIPVSFSNTDFTGDASEDKIHSIYEGERNNVYSSHWSSDGAQSSAHFTQPTENEEGIKSFNNEQKGVHWWQVAASDDSGIQNQQSLRPDESDSSIRTSGELSPFYMAVGSNKAMELEKKKSSKDDDLHHENTIAGKLISGLIKRPGEPLSASGLNGPTPEQAISRTHEGPMTPTYEDSYSEIIPVDYGPQDFDLGPSSISESQTENNKDTLEYLLPNNLGGNQWRQPLYRGHDMPYVHDIGEKGSHNIQHGSWWGSGAGAELTRRDQHLVSSQSVPVFQESDYNKNSFRNSPEASSPGIFPRGALFSLSPSISLDQADLHPLAESGSHFHFSPTGSQHPMIGAAFLQSGGEHTVEQRLYKDSSHGLRHSQSVRSMSQSANSVPLPVSRELKQGAFEQGHINDLSKRNLVDGSTRQHSTADISVARRLRVQRALHKFDRDITGQMQSNIPFNLPLSPQMNSDAYYNNPTGDVFQQSLPEMNVYNQDASQYNEYPSQNYLLQNQLLNMRTGPGNQYHQTSNTGYRTNLEFIPQNQPEYYESHINNQFVPNSAQVETAIFQNPEVKTSNSPQTWFQSQNTYGSFEGYQAPPSLGAKTQGEKVPSQIGELYHEGTYDGEYPEPEKVPPQNYIPIYNYTFAEQKNVQIPIPNSTDSTYPSYDSDLPIRGMEGNQVSASLEPSIQYEYPKTIEVAKVQSPLYPFLEKSYNQRVSEASAPSSFSISNESLLERVEDIPMNGNSGLHDDVSFSTKAPDNLQHMSFVGHLAEQPSGLPVNGMPSGTPEKQSQQQQLGSLLSQHVHQTGVEPIMQQPPFHSVNSFSPPMKKSSSESEKLHQFGTMFPNELKSLHIHQATIPQKEESRLYSNSDSDAARAKYQKWLNERINTQARVLQALQPRSAPGQVFHLSGLNGPSQLSRGIVGVINPSGGNNIEGKMAPVQGDTNFTPVLKISVNLPTYPKSRKWDSPTQGRPGALHPSQDNLIPGHKLIDDSSVAKVLDEKEHLRASSRRLPEQYVAPRYDVRKSSFQTFSPQSVGTATWANKVAMIKSICNGHKGYGLVSSNTLHLPRNKRQVVIYDDFLRDLLKIMNIGEQYLFSSSVTAGDGKINNTFMEDNDNSQLKQFSRNEPSTDDAESVKNEIEIRITADKLKDLCEILQDNPSLLDSVLSTSNPEEARQSAVHQDPTIISLEQVENQSSNIPNGRMLYENSAELPYSHEPHEGSDIGHMYESAGGTQTDHIHETGGDSHTDHIQYPLEGSNTGYLHDTGHDSHSDQWHGPDFDHYHHNADEVSHPDHHHDAGDAFHPDYYHNAGESPHSDNYHNAGEGAHPDHWPNADHSLNTNVGHSPHPDHWNNPMEIIHPGHWHNGEESSDTDHSYHPEDEHYSNHLSNTHNYDSYVTSENSHVFKTDEELGSEDPAEGHAMNHVSSMVEASVDTIRCDDHLEHKLTIQIPADIWKLLQEHSDARRGETLVTLQIEVPVLDNNDSNFEDFPVEALVNTKRNTLEKGKELQFHVSPSFVKADVTKLENERKASDSHYTSQDDVSSLHQRTVSEFLHSLPGMQRTPSFNGPESNASVLQFVPGIYPEGIGQTKRQENSYLIEQEGTRLTPGAAYSSGNVAGFHDNIAGLSTESNTRLAKNDRRLLSLSIYHSQPGGLRVLQEGGGMVPLRVVGPSGEVLYDTNKECQSVQLRAFPATPVPALVTEVRNTVKDRNACNNASCNQLSWSSTYSNGVPSKIPNVQLRSVDDLFRVFQNQNQPSEGRYRNLRIEGGPRYNLDSNSGNKRNIRSSASKEEKEREMSYKVRSTQRHSLSKRTSDGLPSHSPDETMVVDYKRYAADDLGISQRSTKTHRHTDEGESVENNSKDKSRRLPYDSAVATMKLTIKDNNAPILRKDNSEANHFKVLTAEGGSIGTQRHKRRLLWLDDNEDEETLLPRAYPRNHHQLLVGTLSEQTGIVDEQPDVKANPFHHSSQFVERYSDVRGPLDSYNSIQHSTKRSYSHVGSSYFTDLGTSLRRQTKAGERLHVEAPVHRHASPHHQKRKSGLSHYFLKSQLARNHLLPNVEKGKNEPATWQPNSGKQRQRMFLKHRETKVNWHPKQSSQLRQSAYWSTGNIDKFNYPHVQLFDYNHFEPKRGSEVPDKNVSSAADRSLSTGNTTALAQNSEVNKNSIVPSQTPEPQQNRISQSTNTSVTFPPDHSEMSTLELNFNTRAISGNHSEDQSLTSTTECITVENHPHSGTNTAEGSGSGPDKVDASLDLRLKLQYDKNKGALEGEIQDLHFSPKENENESNSNELKIQYDKNKGALEGEIQDFHYSPKENESHENGTQNHSNSNELQHTTSIRSDNTLSYLRLGSVFPAQSVKERLALFEYSVKHGGRYHTFHGMQNGFKRNFDLKEIPKNELPPSNYKSVHNFPFRHEDDALTDTMSHQGSSSNQYPYESSYSQTGVHPYSHLSYFSTNKNTDNVVLGQLTPEEFLQSQSSAETLSHSEPEKWNNENSQSASLSQMKQIENSAGDKVSNADRISRGLANKPHYERLDWVDRSPSYSSYVPEVSNFESLVGKRAGHMHDSYTITGSFTSNTDEEDENAQQGSSQNRRQANVVSGAPNQENIPLRATDEKNLYPFTYTSNENKRNEATNVPIHIPVARSKLNVGVSAKDVVCTGADIDSLDEDRKHHADFDSIEIVHSFQHGRKILHENEDEEDDDDSDNPENDKLLFEYENLQNIRTKRKVNRDDSGFHIHPTSGDKFSNSKRPFHFRNHAKTQRTPKRLHPKFKARSMAKSQRIPSIKKSETHRIKSINSEPVYLTTNLETKKLAHPQDIQMRKTEKIKTDVPKTMHSRVVSNSKTFPVQDNKKYQTLKIIDQGTDKNSKKHTLSTSVMKVRGHTHKKQQLSFNHKIVKPSHSYNKKSKTLLHQPDAANIKLKKERWKENKAKKKSFHTKKHTNTYHMKHSKHKHSPSKRQYLVKSHQRQYRSKGTRTVLDARNILQKHRHHTRMKRSTHETEVNNHEQAFQADHYSGKSRQSEVKNYESGPVSSNKLPIRRYDSFKARSPHKISENIVKSVDLENNFLGINTKSPAVLSHAPVTNETHCLKKMNLQTVGKSGTVKLLHSSKRNYVDDLQEDVSTEKKVKSRNRKLRDKINYHPKTRYCSDGFHHLLPCSAVASNQEDSERIYYQYKLKPEKFSVPGLSTEVLDKRGELQQNSITLKENSKELSSVNFLPSERNGSDELPHKSISKETVEVSLDNMNSLLPHQDILSVGSHMKQGQGPLSGHHIDVDSSVYRNTHNVQNSNSMNISENIIPTIKFTGLSDSTTKNRISELQNLYRHHHLQYANQPKQLLYLNMEESKPAFLSDSVHVFGKGIIGASGNVSNLAEKRRKYDFHERSMFFPNDKLPQKLFHSRSKENFQISDKIKVKHRSRSDKSKTLKFHVDKSPKIQLRNHIKDIRLTKSKNTYNNAHENRVQEDSNIIMNKDSSSFDKAPTLKKDTENMNKLASNCSFNLCKQQLSGQSNTKEIAENLQNAVHQPRLNMVDLSRKVNIRADEAEILTGSDDDTSLETTESDIIVTTIPDIVSDDEEEDEYEMIVSTAPVITTTDAKKKWDIEPEDVTEATDYIEEQTTDTDIPTPVSLQRLSFTETALNVTQLENWPEGEAVTKATHSIEEENNDIEISTSVPLPPVSNAEFVPNVIQIENGPEMEGTNEEFVNLNQITAGADSDIGHMQEQQLATETVDLTESQVDTEIPQENWNTTNMKVEITEMQYEEKNEYNSTKVPEMKGSSGKVTLTSTFFSTMMDAMEFTPEFTVTATITPVENEVTEEVPEEEGTEIINQSKFTSISGKEYKEVLPQVKSTENVSVESMLSETYNTEGSLISESENEGEGEEEVEVEENVTTTEEKETTENQKSERYSAATEITIVLEETPQKSILEGTEEESVQKEKVTELQKSSEESTEVIKSTLATMTEKTGVGKEKEVGAEAGVVVGEKGMGGEKVGEGGTTKAEEEEGDTGEEEYEDEYEDEDEYEEEGGEAGGEEVGEEETTKGIITTLAPVAQEEGGGAGEDEEVGEEEEGEELGEEGVGGEEVIEEETTKGIVTTLEPVAQEEGGGAGEEEDVGEEAGGQEVGEEGVGGKELVGEEETTGGILTTLAPIAEEEGGGAGEEEVGEEARGEEVGEEAVGGEVVGIEEITQGIISTLSPLAEEEEGGAEEVGTETGGEEVWEEGVGGNEVGTEETAEGITVTLAPTAEEEGEGAGEEVVGEETGGEEEGEVEAEQLEIEATSVETVKTMHTESEPLTSTSESEIVEEEVTTEAEPTEGKGMTEEGEESATEETEISEEEEIAEEEETTEVKVTSLKVTTTEETTAEEETTEWEESTEVLTLTEEEGITEEGGTIETEETLEEEPMYEGYLANEGTAQGVEVTSDKMVQNGEKTLTGKLEECHIDKSSCICSLDEMLHELSATTKGNSVLEVASRFNKTCPKSSGEVGKFRITNDMEPIVPHQKERDKNTVHLMKNITAIGIMTALAVRNTAISGQETLIFPGSHLTIPCANKSEMFQVDDRGGISYQWWSPSGKELTVDGFPNDLYNAPCGVRVNTLLRTIRGSGGHTELIEDGKYMRLSGVVPRDDGTYRCEIPTSDNRTGSPSNIHRVKVVQLPQIVQQATMRYKVTPHCREDMAQLLQMFLAPMVRKAVCGQLCSISIPKASCIKGEMLVIFLSRIGHAHLLLPGHVQSNCDVMCSAKVDAIFARTAALNLPRVLTSKVSSRLSYRTADLSPIHGNLAVSLLEGCPAGFGLQDGLCTPCDAGRYSGDDDPNCRECPEGEYQPDRGSQKCLPCPHPFAAATCLALFHQRYTYTAMITAGSLLLFIALLLLIILPTIRRQNSLKGPPRTPPGPDKHTGHGKRSSDSRQVSVRHVSGDRKPTNYGNVGYTAVNIEPPEEDVYHKTYRPERFSRPELIRRSQPQIENEVNRLLDEAAIRLSHRGQLSLAENQRSTTVPGHVKSHLIFDDEEKQIMPVNTYGSSLVSSGNRDYMQQGLVGTQRPAVSFYDNSQGQNIYREWEESSKQRKHRRTKSHHTRNSVNKNEMDHYEERKIRHTEAQPEHEIEKSPPGRDLRRQDSFISNLGLILEEDESGPDDKLQTLTVQRALPDWHKENVSTYLVPLSKDGTGVVRKQAPSPPPPDF